MSQTPTVPPIVSQAMKFMLRSPMHGMVSNTLLLITFTGRKSGKTYTTPVSYSQRGNQIYIFTHANWWKNLCNGAPVTLRVRGRALRGLAETVAEDKQAIAVALSEHLKKVPFDAKFYGLTFDEYGNPNAEQVRNAAETVVMIRVKLC